MKRYKDAEYHFDFDYEFEKFELLDCELLSDEEDLKVLKAHEFWDLVLKTAEGKVFFYKVMNFQTYFLRKDQDMQWKIWDNYNPNFQRVIKKYIKKTAYWKLFFLFVLLESNTNSLLVLYIKYK